MSSRWKQPCPRFNRERRSVAVKVGNVTVGGGAPIVVQSMTNTDTADVEGTAPGRGARPRRLGAGAHHRRPRRGGGGRAAHQGPAAQDGRRRAAHRRLPLHRPQAAGRPSGLRRGARQVPDQSGNVGFQEKRDRQFAAIIEMAIKHDKPVRIGVNWGSLDQELLTHLMDENTKSPDAAGRARGDARGDGAVGAALGGARRGDRPAARPDHPLGQGLGRAGSDRVYRARPALRLCDPSRPDRGGHGLEGHRRLLRRARHPAAAGHRRHHPHFAHARARRRPHARSEGGAGAPADHGLPHVRADGRRLPRLRAHHLDHVPGAGQRHPGLHPSTRCRSGRSAIRASRS